jgi:hypothetical protein
MTRVALLLLPLALFLSSCCTCGRTAEEHWPPTRITLSNGGGVSGMQTGYTLHPDGLVTYWVGKAGMRERTDTLGTVGTAQLRAVLRHVYATPLSTIMATETGNMTTMLEIVEDEVVYRFSWPGIIEDSTPVPPELRPLRDVILGTVKELRSYE